MCIVGLTSDLNMKHAVNIEQSYKKKNNLHLLLNQSLDLQGLSGCMNAAAAAYFFSKSSRQ